MIKFIDILKEVKADINESSSILTIYRGINPKFGDIEHGRMSIGPKHKLVGALGPNYTDKKEVAERYGKQVVSKQFSSPRILELSSYDDIIKIYKEYENQLTPGLAHFIKNASNDSEQFEYIKKAAKELRDILSKKYDLVKAPLGPGDINYLKGKGIEGGSLYILLK